MTDTYDLVAQARHYRCGHPMVVHVDVLVRDMADEVERLRVGLGKINDIRNKIVGAQNMGWSSCVYPMVAALEEAGFEGEGYDVAREKLLVLNAYIDCRNAVVEAARDHICRHPGWEDIETNPCVICVTLAAHDKATDAK